MPLSSMVRAISGTMSCPFQGATRPGTSKIRAAGGICQTLRKAPILAGSTAAGSNAAMSMQRGMMVSRSRAILWRAITGAAAKFEDVITQSPRVSPAAQYARRWEAGGTSLRCRHVGDPRSASALRVYDVDPLGGDEALQSAGASPELEWIDSRIHERNPFAAGSRELLNERPVLACHDGARADFPQRGCHIQCSAGDRLLAQCRHDLQYGRCGQSARVYLPLVVAHGVLSFVPRRLVCRSAVL